MGNSEVGHLNLGAGQRGDAGPDPDRRGGRATGELAANEVLRDALTGAERVHLIGLVSDGGVHSSLEHLRALIELAASLEVPDLVAARLHRRPRHAAEVGRRLPGAGGGVDGGGRGGPGRLGRRPLLRDGPRQALGPGPARLRPARPRPGRAHALTAAPRPRATPTSATRPTSSSRRCVVGDGGADPPRGLGAGPQLPSRPDARDHARAGRPGVRRDRPRRRRAGRALRDDDRVRGGLAVPGGVPAGAAGDDAVGGDRGPRRAAAARRRDREVPARDVLLQRRRGGRLRGRAARAGALAARRAHLRPQAGDERSGGGRGVRAGVAARTRRGSGSSTSPTPTWSATPA